MGESREVYQQMFDAQVQLSRHLQAGRRDMRTECLSADETNCSTTTRRQQIDDDDDDDDDDDADEVSRLPDTVGDHRHHGNASTHNAAQHPVATPPVAPPPSSDIIQRLMTKRKRNQDDALRQLNQTLKELTEDCERDLRAEAQQLLSSLKEADGGLDLLKLHLAADQLHQEVCVLWQQLEEKMKMKKRRITDFGTKLLENEQRRTREVGAALRCCCVLLENSGLLNPADVHRLLHTEAMMLNQSLLANRRSSAHLLLRLREETLQQEWLLRRQWEELLDTWRRTRVQEVLHQFRSLCRTDQDQDQDQDQDLVQVQRGLTERRRDIIYQISSLAPPTCSISLVSDWFDQITAVNQQLDGCHADLHHRWRCGLDRVSRERLAQVERCQEALSTLQLQQHELKEALDSQLRPLIGRLQTEEEERLAAVEVCGDHAARHALHLSRAALLVMRAAALLWETHRRRLARREEELQRHLEDVRRSHQQDIQRKKAHMDDLLGALRQTSSREAARESLDRAVLHLRDVKDSCSRCVSSQWDVLDHFPSVLHDELVSYSRGLSSFFSLSPAYQPSPEEVQKLHPSPTCPAHLDPGQSLCPVRLTDPPCSAPPKLFDTLAEPGEDEPIVCQDDAGPAHSAHDWLTEAESSLMEFYDIGSYVSVVSSGGVAYSGPAFRCPALPDQLQQDTHLSVFPVQMLTHTLSRARTRFLDHLEQHFVDVLNGAVAMVTERKEAVRLEEELQLQHLDPEHIHTHVYQPRLAELRLHQQQVALHCQDMLDIRTSCWTRLEELRSSVSRTDLDFLTSLSSMETQVQDQDQVQKLQVVSAALQDSLDGHIRDTQRRTSSFRRSVSAGLEEVRTRTAQLLASFSRLFSEGGDFSPQEVKTFQKRLSDLSRQTDQDQDAILSELQTLESRSFHQVREASARLEEKLSLLKSKVKFLETIQKLRSNTHILLQAETHSSNQQQAAISCKIQDLRTMLQDSQVFPVQVLELLSSLSEDLRRRCQYLDLHWDSALQDSRALQGPSGSRVQVQQGPGPGLLQVSRRGLDLLEDPVVDLIRSLSRLGSGSAAKREDPGPGPGPRPGQGSVQNQRRSKSGGAVRRVQVDQGLGSRSFSWVVDSTLWSSNAAALQAAEEFSRLSRFQPGSEPLHQSAESLKQGLLGNQEEASRFLSTSREVVLKQLSDLDQLLHSVPEVLIRNHEERQWAELKEEVGGVRQKLKETLSASEKEKDLNLDRLRASLGDEDLQQLDSRETLRQQQLHDATCRAHLDIKECARQREEEFVTSLSSLTEKLLPLLDNLGVTMETRTRHDVAESLPGVTMVTNTTRITQRRQGVSVERDAAVERFQQLVLSESSQADEDKRRQLSHQHTWNTHWRRQIHTLRRTLQ